MLCKRMRSIQYLIVEPKIWHLSVLAHSKSCPAIKPKPPPTNIGVCGAGGGAAGGDGGARGRLQRAEHGGKVRLGFIPDTYFLFFHVKTGVTGPYLFLIGLTNYLVSKEIFVMEHEYYCGLSLLVMVGYVVGVAGPGIGASLDKEVDKIIAEHNVARNMEIKMNEDTIKDAQLAQARAKGQMLLMDAKKENILMQQEAIYRERAMMVYRTVKGRMDYHLKKYQAEARIHQKWMIDWILREVKSSITPEFEKQALDRAIQDLAQAASRA